MGAPSGCSRHVARTSPIDPMGAAVEPNHGSHRPQWVLPSAPMSAPNGCFCSPTRVLSCTPHECTGQTQWVHPSQPTTHCSIIIDPRMLSLPVMGAPSERNVCSHPNMAVWTTTMNIVPNRRSHRSKRISHGAAYMFTWSQWVLRRTSLGVLVDPKWVCSHQPHRMLPFTP